MQKTGVWWLGLMFCGFWAWGASEPKSPAVPIPPGAEILARLKKEHPRLLAAQADFVRLKQQIEKDAAIRDLYGKVREQGRKMLKEEPAKYEIPDGLRLLNTSRRVLNRAQTLALLYRLDGDRAWLARAWREMEAAAQFKDWNPRHFLDTAEMTHAFAIAYDWLYDAWTPQQRQTLKTAMLEKGLNPALEIYRKNSSWSRARHNWNQVCNGGLGIGALALGHELPGPAAEILEASLKSLQLPMAEFNPDGAWAEGPGYWSYATSYNVAYLAALDTALGTDFGLSKMPGFSEAGMFPLYATGPTGRTFNYADAGDGPIRAPQLFWLARKFNQPFYAWFQRQSGSAGPLDLLWFDPRGEAPTPDRLPLDKYFRNSEVVSLRSAWNDRHALFIGFKAGDNKANHSNLDLGTFVLDALGCRWAADLGADNYNLPGYFGRQRWTYYRMRAEAHNTLVLNPGQEPDQSPSAAAKIIQFGARPDRAFAVADLTTAYAQHATRVQRGVALLERRQVLIQDEIQAKSPAECWWFMTTPAKIAIADGGKAALLTQGQAALRAQILAPANARFSEMPAAPLPSSPNPDQQKVNTGYRKLAVQLRPVSDLRLAILLLPETGPSAPSIPALRPLAEWK